jgi:hypothetical protein
LYALAVVDDFKYKSESLLYLESNVDEVVYKDWGLTLEKYWIFLNAEASDKVDKPTLEKSSKFKLEFLEEGERTTWLGVDDID